MMKNYFNCYGYNYDKTNLGGKTIVEINENIKAIKRDRVIATIIRIAMIILAINMFLEPFMTNMPLGAALVMGIAILYLSTFVKDAIETMSMRLNDNMDAYNNYDKYVMAYRNR